MGYPASSDAGYPFRGSDASADTGRPMPTTARLGTRPLSLAAAMPAPSSLTPARAEEHRDRLVALRASLLSFEPDAHQLAELCGMAALHFDPWVRAELLAALPQWRMRSPAEIAEAVAWATHDAEDFVAFRAISLVAALGLASALPHLIMIVGRASERLTREAGKPVGMGHALVLNAITRAAGTDDPVELAKIETALFRGDYDPPTEFAPSRPQARPAATADRRDMVRIPSGTVSFRIPPALERGKPVFDWTDVKEPWVADVEEFWMDRCLVSCAEYDSFTTSDGAKQHIHCHPAEPSGKLHVRNTVLDRRFGPDAPATGVDWFDAYAYAHSRGKRLPSEAEWQRAAQGDDLRAFPWGDAFDSKRAQWVGRVLGFAPPSLTAWRQQLVHMGHDHGAELVCPVTAGPPGPFGTLGMAGNAWEWTATNFYSKSPLEPDVGSRDTLEVVYDWNSYPVIRGGSWSSLPELMSAAFRGRDLLTDRHFENGFRCVAS